MSLSDMMREKMKMVEEEPSSAKYPKIPDIYFLVAWNREYKWYSPITKSSSSRFLEPALSPFPEPIKRLQFASIGSKIYACGGFYPHPDPEFEHPTLLSTDKVFCIDTRHPKEEWKTVARMNEDRLYHYMMADAGKIYVLAGLRKRDPIPNPEDEKKRPFAEVYDPNFDEWRVLALNGDTEVDLPQPIYGHAVVDHGPLGRKILFHSRFRGSLYYLNTSRAGDIGVYSDKFGQFHPVSAFLDGVLYFLSHNRIYACDVTRCSEYTRVVLHDVKTNTLPDRGLDESMPSSFLLSLGNRYLALIWAKDPEFQSTFLHVHCSIIEMSRKGNGFEGKVLDCSSYSIQRGRLDGCLAVHSREDDGGLDA